MICLLAAFDKQGNPTGGPKQDQQHNAQRIGFPGGKCFDSGGCFRYATIGTLFQEHGLAFQGGIHVIAADTAIELVKQHLLLIGSKFGSRHTHDAFKNGSNKKSMLLKFCRTLEDIVAIMVLGAEFLQKAKRMHSVGFEPTHTNIFELESNPLDRSGMNATDTYTTPPSF
eukprot:scaffold692_cov118-Cylindrotheca_fusiformis.AAC.19